MASQLQVFSPPSVSSSAFCSAKKLKIEPSGWDVSGQSSNDKYYTHSKTLPATQGQANSSHQVANFNIPAYDQGLLLPAPALRGAGPTSPRGEARSLLQASFCPCKIAGDSGDSAQPGPTGHLSSFLSIPGPLQSPF